MGFSGMAIVWSGFVAATLSAAVFVAFRSFELTRFSPLTELGSIFVRSSNVPLTETVGFLLFLALGVALVPPVYVLALPALGGPGIGSGLVAGAVHGAVAVAAIPLLERTSVRVRDGSLPPAGRLGLGWGWATPLALMAGHAAYGVVLGGLLGAF
jgi:hypothetical protein